MQYRREVDRAVARHVLFDLFEERPRDSVAPIGRFQAHAFGPGCPADEDIVIAEIIRMRPDQLPRLSDETNDDDQTPECGMRSGECGMNGRGRSVRYWVLGTGYSVLGA